MYVITCMGRIIKYVTSEEPTIVEDNGIEFLNLHQGLWVPKASFLVFITEEPLPLGEIAEKYCYDNGFVLNPDYHMPESYLIQRIEMTDTQVLEHELNQAETELDIDARLSVIELGLV